MMHHSRRVSGFRTLGFAPTLFAEILAAE